MALFCCSILIFVWFSNETQIWENQIYNLRYEIWTATESEMSDGDSPADDLSTEAADYRTKVNIVYEEKTYQTTFAR